MVLKCGCDETSKCVILFNDVIKLNIHKLQDVFASSVMSNSDHLELFLVSPESSR